MRVIGGKLKNRKIFPPSKMPFTRPTTDFAKEGLFNVLENYFNFDSLHCLDLFAGTGAISLEFISRGIKKCISVEKNVIMFEHIKKCLETFEINNVELIRMDVIKFIKFFKPKYDIAFAGPPYRFSHLENLPNIIFSNNNIDPQKVLFILEHNSSHSFTTHQYFNIQKKYGGTTFSFFGGLLQ